MDGESILANIMDVHSGDISCNVAPDADEQWKTERW